MIILSTFNIFVDLSIYNVDRKYTLCDLKNRYLK